MPEYRILRAVRAAMRDGTELTADIFLPEGTRRVPTLLQRTPYGRDVAFGTQHIQGMETIRALDAGFAVVIQDTRGRPGSGDRLRPFVHESDDGADTVAWIRRQPFSNGQVATYGASYVGATQMLLAAQAPEGHVAMAPFFTTGDYHQPWTYQGGALQLGFLWSWITEALGPMDVLQRGGPDSPRLRETLGRLMADPEAAMTALPLVTDDLLELAPYLKDWTGNPTPGSFWPAIRPLDRTEQMTVRGLHIVGLNDIFARGSLLSYRTLRERGATAQVRDGQYLLIGPWAHGNIGDWQGDEWHGYGAATSAIDLAAIQLEFFAAAFEGREPNLPRVRYFVTGANEWRTGDAWPPSSREQILHLAPGGALVYERPAPEGADQYRSNPLDPVPTAGGQTFLPGVLMGKNSGPKDQGELEARDDVLVYRSGPLERPLDVLGDVALHLWASSSAEDCDWTARLVDVDEVGNTRGIADGILRARYRHGSVAEPLEPGQVEHFVLSIGDVAHQFGAGHRIGLQVASSNFPRFDRNPQRLVNPVTASVADFVVADQTVYRGGSRASRLVLSVA